MARFGGLNKFCFERKVQMITLGVVTDIQYADKATKYNNNYRGSLEKFLAAAGYFTERKVPVVMQLGDIMDGGWTDLSVMLELMKISRLNFRHVLGNHDFTVSDAKKKEIPSLLGLPDCGWYRLQISDEDDPSNAWRFLVMNGVEKSLVSAATPEERQEATALRKKYLLPDGSLQKPWNGYVTKTQLDWLRGELQQATQKKERVLIFSHFPLFVQRDGKDIYHHLSGGGSTWNGGEVLQVIDAYPCIKGFFAGHAHEGGYGFRKQVHHVTFKGMVYNDPNAAAVLNFGKDRIVIQGFGAEESRELKI